LIARLLAKKIVRGIHSIFIGGANACSIKGDVKEHFSPCTGGADIFRDIQPLSPLKTLVWCRALWGWVCVVPYQQVDLLGCDNAERFLKLGKRCGCTVSTMILVSATHPTAETLTCSAST